MELQQGKSEKGLSTFADQMFSATHDLLWVVQGLSEFVIFSALAGPYHHGVYQGHSLRLLNLGRPQGYLLFSLMALVGDHIY